jgi:hypothetical protein
MEPTPQTYPEVLRGLFLSLHSRRFLLALVGATLTFFGAKYGLPAETIALIMTPITAFILGESYQGGKQAQAAIFTEGTTPALPSAETGPAPIDFTQPLPSFEDAVKSTAVDLASDRVSAVIDEKIEAGIEKYLGKLVKS